MWGSGGGLSPDSGSGFRSIGFFLCVIDRESEMISERRKEIDRLIEGLI